VIAIRLAAEADAPALATIAVAVYQRYVPRIGRPPAPMTADYPAAVRRGQAWVAATGGEVAGFIILIPRPGYLLLDNVTVLAAAQGQGIGARLLALAEDRARALHLPEIRLYTNAAMTENLAYYPRHGYTETHRAHQDGFHRVFFRKRAGHLTARIGMEGWAGPGGLWWPLFPAALPGRSEALIRIDRLDHLVLTVGAAMRPAYPTSSASCSDACKAAVAVAVDGAGYGRQPIDNADATPCARHGRAVFADRRTNENLT
jgi:GNAT superfamily N-acetyltransferase